MGGGKAHCSTLMDVILLVNFHRNSGGEKVIYIFQQAQTVPSSYMALKVVIHFPHRAKAFRMISTSSSSLIMG